MRIFCSTLHWFPPRLVDVVELFVVQLARRGVVTDWYAQRGEPGPHGMAYLHGQVFTLPLNLPPNKGITKLINKMLYWFFDWLIAIKHIKNPPDIFQARDKYVGALAGLFAASFSKKKFVYWMSYPFPEHDLEMAKTASFPRSLTHQIRGTLGKRLLYGFIMSHADHVFVQSEQMLEDVANYGVPRKKMSPVPMGVPPRIFDWVKSNETQKIEPGKIVYTGTMARVRRLEVLIEAFVLVHKSKPDAHLYMVGDGNTPDERADLEALASRHGLTDAITFTGFLPMEQAWAHAASAQVCLSPFYPTFLLRSCSPTKLLEYMALGRPVVANDHPEQSAILQQSGAGLCVPWGAESFAGAIVELLVDPEKAQDMGVCGPAWVAENRTYDKLAARLHARYCALLEDKI